jgi:hypothetical protein
MRNRGDAGGGWASHIEEASSHLEGLQYVGAEHHPELCHIC